LHEIGLCEAIMEAVERRAEGRPVSRVKVRVGARHRVVPPSFDQAFSLVSDGTVAEAATLDLELIPARITCGTCGEQTDADDVFAVCPRCGSTDLEIEGGDDLMLESIDIRPSD
jgi:hydrogenase nickel incorporation protein HypA/HybF